MVLPFEDQSPLKDQEYFADGLTQELIGALDRVDGLQPEDRDQGFNVGHVLGLGAPAPPNHPMLQEIRARVFAATRAARIFFLNACNGQDVVSMIDEGVMICTSGGTAASTNGRQHTKRQMPW